MDDITRRRAVTAAAAGAIGLGAAIPAEAQDEAKKVQDAPGGQDDRGARIQEGSEFIVKMNGLKLPEEAERRIASEIQAAVMRELARVDLRAGGFGGGFGVRIPNREWYGLWLERVQGLQIPHLQATPRAR